MKNRIWKLLLTLMIARLLVLTPVALMEETLDMRVIEETPAVAVEALSIEPPVEEVVVEFVDENGLVIEYEDGEEALPIDETATPDDEDTEVQPIETEAMEEFIDAELIPLEAEKERFPDDNFRACIVEYDTDGDGKLSDSEINGIYELGIEEQNISSLQGIEYFTNLTYLYCDYNHLAELDLSQNTNLKYLDCSNNELTELLLSNNIYLVYLYCDYNQIQSLDLSHNSMLNEIHVVENDLKELDLSRANNLQTLRCNRNELTNLNISKNKQLKYLECKENKLSQLDTSQNIKLEYLDCRGNRFDELNITHNGKLTTIYCGNDDILTVDVSGTLLAEIVAGSYLISDDYKIYNQNGYYLMCGQDVTFIVGTYNNVVPIDTVHFPDDSFREYIMNTFDYNSDGVLSDIEIKYATSISIIDSKIGDLLGLEYLTNVKTLEFQRCLLKDIDLSLNQSVSILDISNCDQLGIINGNELVNFIYIFDTPLDELDLESFPNLISLRCSRNGLKLLNVSKNDKIRQIECTENMITSLDLSYNRELYSIDCSNNQLTELILPDSIILEDVSCYGNKLTELDVRNCERLSELFQSSDLERNKWYSNDGYGYIGYSVESQLGGYTIIELDEDVSIIAENVKTIGIDSEHFPDDGFRLYVSTLFDRNKNGLLSEGEISFAKEVRIAKEDNVHTLDGIKYLTALELLNVADSDITELKLEYNKELRTIQLYNTRVSALDATNYSGLKHITVAYSPLKMINVRNCKELRELYLSNCPIDSIDISQNPNLIGIECTMTNADHLDLSNNPNLYNLICYGNKFTELDVSKCPHLVKALESPSTWYEEDTEEGVYYRTYYVMEEIWDSPDHIADPIIVLGKDLNTITKSSIQQVLLTNGMKADINMGEKLQIRVEDTTVKKYSSNKPKIASVDDNGLVATLAAGTAKITAKLANGKSRVLTLTVVDPTVPTAVKLGEAFEHDLNQPLTLGYTLEPVTAVDTVTWSASPTSVATVDKEGNVTVKKMGKCTFTATSKKNKKVKGTVKVTFYDPAYPTSVVLDEDFEHDLNQPLRLAYTLEPSSAISEVTWKASPTSIATVDKDGNVTVKKAGKCTFTATSKKNTKAKGSVKVSFYDPAYPTGVKVGEAFEHDLNQPLRLSYTLEPSTAISEVTWKANPTSIATVDKDGNVTVKKAGKCTFTATSKKNAKARGSVKVSFIDPYLPTGIKLDKTGTVTIDLAERLDLTASLTPSTAISDIEWKTSSSKIATVDNGTVIPGKAGTVTITAIAKKNKKSAKVKVIIKDLHAPTGVTIDQGKSITLKVGESLRLSATVMGVDGYAPRDAVTWSNSAKKIVELDQNGNIKALSAGTAKITVKAEKKSASITVKVVK